MNFNELRTMARRMGINTHGMKKKEIIRAIQITGGDNIWHVAQPEKAHWDNVNIHFRRDDSLSLLYK